MNVRILGRKTVHRGSVEAGMGCHSSSPAPLLVPDPSPVTCKRAGCDDDSSQAAAIRLQRARARLGLK